MKKKAFSREVVRLQTLCERWVDKLTPGWRVSVICEPRRRQFWRGRNCQVLMSTACDWRYLEATITANVKACAELSDHELERTFIHELIHLLVNELAGQDSDHEEHAVSLLTAAVCTAYYLDPPKET